MDIVYKRAVQAELMHDSDSFASVIGGTRGPWDAGHQELRLLYDWNLLLFLTFLTSHSHQDCFVSVATFK